MRVLLPLLLTVAQSNGLIGDVRTDYRMVRDYVIRSAEKMPEADYAFKPTPEVRSFAQQIAHIADDQLNYCSYVKGEKRPAAYSALEKTLSAKADLVPAIQKAFAYCDTVYDALTDATAAEIVTAHNRPQPKLGVLAENTSHTSLHYGNIIVYLRLKGLVPPSSERASR